MSEDAGAGRVTLRLKKVGCVLGFVHDKGCRGAGGGRGMWLTRVSLLRASEQEPLSGVDDWRHGLCSATL